MGKSKQPSGTKSRTNKKDYDDDDIYNEVSSYGIII